MNLETQLRRKIRSQGKADSTANSYWHHVQSFLRFAKDQRGEWVEPKEMGKRQVEIWLSYLANERNVSANTQNQAFSAVCYLYRHVIGQPLEDVSALRAKRPDRIKEVVDQSDLVKLFQELKGVSLLSAMLMYACSFRIGEIARIRIKDISFERKQIVVRGGKGEKDRVVGFPNMLHAAVRQQIDSMRIQHQRDVANGLNGVSLPKSFGRKSTSAHTDFAWWYLFASGNYSKCPTSGRLLRHHCDTGNIARNIKQAATRSGIGKRVTSHCLRHSFATHSLENGVPIHVIQKLLGHTSIETTETYLHVSKDGVTSARSPLETLLANPAIATEARADRRQSTERPHMKLFTG